MNRVAWAVSATLCENEPSPQSPSESPRPRLSKRSIPTPSLASCLQIGLAAGLFLPSVKPCENTPQPRVGPSGWSITPASRGPLVLGNQTLSATSVILSSRTRGGRRERHVRDDLAAWRRLGRKRRSEKCSSQSARAGRDATRRAATLAQVHDAYQSWCLWQVKRST